MKQSVIKSILGGAAALALVTGLVACGSSDDTVATPQGQVTKGPVKGATVYDKHGVKIGETDAHGMFPLTGEGPYSTHGGTFVDIATGVETAAPDLKAPAGARNITPITTLIAEHPELKAKIESLGVAFDDSLSTVTAENKDAIALNECIGAAIVEIKKSSTNDTVATARLTDFLANVSANVNTLTVPPSGSVDLAEIESKMKNAASQTSTLPSSVVATVNTKLHNTYVKAEELKEGEKLQPVTGSTGGTSNN